MPHRCICPPRVRIEQYGYNCDTGNPLACIGAKGGFIGGDITQRLDDPKNMQGANFSLTNSAFLKRNYKAWMTTGDMQEIPYMINDMNTLRNEITTKAKMSLKEACKKIPDGPNRKRLHKCNSVVL